MSATPISTRSRTRSAIPSSRAPFRNPVVLDGGRTILVNPGLGDNDRFDFGTVWAFRDGRATQVLALPRSAIDGMSYDGASRSMLVSARNADGTAVIRVGNTGIAQHFPRLAAACAKPLRMRADQAGLIISRD